MASFAGVWFWERFLERPTPGLPQCGEETGTRMPRHPGTLRRVASCPGRGGGPEFGPGPPPVRSCHCLPWEKEAHARSRRGYQGAELKGQALESADHGARPQEDSLIHRRRAKASGVERRDVRETCRRSGACADDAEIPARCDPRRLRRACPQHRVITRVCRTDQLYRDNACGVGNDEVLRRQVREDRRRRRRRRVERFQTEEGQLAVDPDEQVHGRACHEGSRTDKRS